MAKGKVEVSISREAYDWLQFIADAEGKTLDEAAYQVILKAFKEKVGSMSVSELVRVEVDIPRPLYEGLRLIHEKFRRPMEKLYVDAIRGLLEVYRGNAEFQSEFYKTLCRLLKEAKS